MVRVYEIARDMGIENKALVALFQAIGIHEVRNHMSVVSPINVDRAARFLRAARFGITWLQLKYEPCGFTLGVIIGGKNLRFNTGRQDYAGALHKYMMIVRRVDAIKGAGGSDAAAVKGISEMCATQVTGVKKEELNTVDAHSQAPKRQESGPSLEIWRDAPTVEVDRELVLTVGMDLVASRQTGQAISLASSWRRFTVRLTGPLTGATWTRDEPTMLRCKCNNGFLRVVETNRSGPPPEETTDLKTAMAALCVLSVAPGCVNGATSEKPDHVAVTQERRPEKKDRVIRIHFSHGPRPKRGARAKMRALPSPHKRREHRRKLSSGGSTRVRECSVKGGTYWATYKVTE